MNAPRLTASLTMDEWQLVIAHLRVGQYEQVADLIAALASQLAPQIQLAEMPEQIKAERQAFRTVTAASAPADACVSSTGGDDTPQVH